MMLTDKIKILYGKSKANQAKEKQLTFLHYHLKS